MNIDQYLPVLLFILIGMAVGVVPLVLGYVLGPNRPDAAKNSPTNAVSRRLKTRA
jgi:NADH-quinone oxidoreductase subunit A